MMKIKMVVAKNIKNQVAIALFSLLLFAGAVNSQQPSVSPSSRSTSTPLVPPQPTSPPTLSNQERDKLPKQLKEEIKQQVENEVYRSFGPPFTNNLSIFITALSILVGVLGILLVIFPLAASVSIWRLRQPLLAQISEEVENFRDSKKLQLDPLVSKAQEQLDKLQPSISKAQEELDKLLQLRNSSEAQRKNRILSQLDHIEKQIFSNLPDFVQEVLDQVSPAYWPSKAKIFISLEYWKSMSGLIEEVSILVDFNQNILRLKSTSRSENIAYLRVTIKRH